MSDFNETVTKVASQQLEPLDPSLSARDRALLYEAMKVAGLRSFGDDIAKGVKKLVGKGQKNPAAKQELSSAFRAVGGSPAKKTTDAAADAASNTRFTSDDIRDIKKTLLTGSILAPLVGGFIDPAAEQIGEHVFGDSTIAKERSKMKAQQLHKIENRELLDPIHGKVIKQLIKEDDVLKDADPKLVRSSYQTMTNFAPTLAADPNAARSFLREHAIHGTGPSYASMKTLADAERSVSDAGGIVPFMGKSAALAVASSPDLRKVVAAAPYSTPKVAVSKDAPPVDDLYSAINFLGQKLAAHSLKQKRIQKGLEDYSKL